MVINNTGNALEMTQPATNGCFSSGPEERVMVKPKDFHIFINRIKCWGLVDPLLVSIKESKGDLAVNVGLSIFTVNACRANNWTPGKVDGARNVLQEWLHVDLDPGFAIVNGYREDLKLADSVLVVSKYKQESGS
jgi:hypothetical protein